jgi:GNAT superfamily N-acetyltransferase
MSLPAGRRVTYPARQVTLRDGSPVTLRGLQPADAGALVAFFAALPAEDRYWMKDDVTDPDIVRRWAEESGTGRSVAVVAEAAGQIVADAVLVHHRGTFRAHQAEIRVSILPAYRGKGLGTILVRDLAELAWELDLEFVEFELVAGPQDAAIEAVRSLGAFEAGTLSDFVRDAAGRPHDVVFLRIALGSWFRF